LRAIRISPDPFGHARNAFPEWNPRFGIEQTLRDIVPGERMHNFVAGR
jgi:hypothetical protein